MSSWAKIILKTAVSAVLIAYLLTKVNLAEVWETVRTANWLVLGLAFCMFYLGYAITAARWKTLLRALGDTTDYWFLVRSFMVAVFFNNFLPSTIGGDAIRMYDSWQSGSSKTRAVAAVVMDRFMGLQALLFFALAAVWFGSYDVLNDSGILHAVAGATAVVVILLMIVMFMPRSLSEWGVCITNKLDSRIGSIVTAVLQSIEAFRNNHKAVILAIVLSFLLQANVVLYHWIVAGALGLTVPLSAFFLIVPIAIVVMMIPISINGIGVREGVFVLLLGAHGVPESAGLAYAWVIYILLVLQGLIGGIVFAFRRDAGQRATRSR